MVGIWQNQLAFTHNPPLFIFLDDEADVVTLDGGDIYIAGEEYGMKPVVAEDYGDNDVSYWAIAVTKATSSITFDNLKAKKSCHTGKKNYYLDDMIILTMDYLHIHITIVD